MSLEHLRKINGLAKRSNSTPIIRSHTFKAGDFSKGDFTDCTRSPGSAASFSLIGLFILSVRAAFRTAQIGIDGSGGGKLSSDGLVRPFPPSFGGSVGFQVPPPDLRPSSARRARKVVQKASRKSISFTFLNPCGTHVFTWRSTALAR
jgi:hypothetical protein